MAAKCIGAIPSTSRIQLISLKSSAQLRSLLRAGDRRVLGPVSQVVNAVLQDPGLVPTLVRCMLEEDEATRMRAADALEKVSRKGSEGIQPYSGVLLDLFEETEQQELLWHLAVILPRLKLDANERRRTSLALQQCLDAKSSIVKTFALQGLFDLATQEPALLPMILDLLRTAERSGTPAMKARSRKLIAQLENQRSNRSNQSG